MIMQTLLKCTSNDFHGYIFNVFSTITLQEFTTTHAFAVCRRLLALKRTKQCKWWISAEILCHNSAVTVVSAANPPHPMSHYLVPLSSLVSLCPPSFLFREIISARPIHSQPESQPTGAPLQQPCARAQKLKRS